MLADAIYINSPIVQMMKINILILLTLIAFTVNAFGQVKTASGFQGYVNNRAPSSKPVYRVAFRSVINLMTNYFKYQLKEITLTRKQSLRRLIKREIEG